VLSSIETVIVDEIHALVPTKRGAHLAISLERLETICVRSPQRVGLSATQRPLDEVARFLGGAARRGRPARRPRSAPGPARRAPTPNGACTTSSPTTTRTPRGAR
jgi:ATP-dependent helicase Lhr and Lhr-like helicase